MTAHTTTRIAYARGCIVQAYNDGSIPLNARILAVADEADPQGTRLIGMYDALTARVATLEAALLPYVEADEASLARNKNDLNWVLTPIKQKRVARARAALANKGQA